MSTQTSRPVDSLVFPGESLFGTGSEAPALFSSLNQAGIDDAVLAPPRGQDYVMRPMNEWVASLAAQSPGSRKTLGRIDPNHRSAHDEVAYCSEVLGVSGFFLHPWEEHFSIDSARTASTIEAIADRGLPLVVHAGVPWLSEPLQIAVVSDRHPELDIVMTNGGQFNISGFGQDEAFEAMEQASRLRLLTSGIYRQDFIESAVRRFGAERVIFASSAPFFDPRYEIRRVLEAHLTREERTTMAGLAAKALFW